MKPLLPLLMVIILAVICRTAIAQTPASPASPAPASTSSSSAPSPAVADLIKQAQSLVQAGSFDQAVSLLTKQLSATSNAADQAALQSSLADAHYSWSNHLLLTADFSGALDHLQAAYSLDQKLRPMQAGHDLRRMGVVYNSRGDYAQALNLYKRSLDLAQLTSDRTGQEQDLGNMALVYYDEAQYAQALDYNKKSMTLALLIGDRRDVEEDLENIGLVYTDIGQFDRALDYCKRSLEQAQSIGEAVDVEHSLETVGIIYFDLSQYAQALDYDKKSLVQAQVIGDKLTVLHVLGNIGDVYMNLSQYDQALNYDQKALTQAELIGDKQTAECDQENIGLVYEDMGQYAQALHYDKMALAQAQSIGDDHAKERTLNTIGGIYYELGQYDQSLDYCKQSLTQAQQIGDKEEVGACLETIGVIYEAMGQCALALDYAKNSLSQAQQIGDKQTIERDLGNIGDAYENLGQYDQALDYNKRSWMQAKQIGDKQSGEHDLANIGTVYEDLGENTQAMASFQQALALQREIGDRQTEGATLAALMSSYEKQGRTSLAIFYGKEAVNTYQSIRKDIGTRNAGLDPISQKSYLGTVASAYRSLSDLLISTHRLAEAQQVLALLKEQEFFDYIHPDRQEHGGMDMKLDPVSLTPREARWSKRLDGVSTPLASLCAQITTLQNEKQPSSADRTKLASLRLQMQAAEAAFSKTLTAMAADFSGRSTWKDRLPGTAQADMLAHTLPPGAAAIDTIVGDDKLYLICITPAQSGHPARTVARTVPITSKALYAKVVSCRAALMNPNQDPRPLAKEFYQFLVAPVAGQIRQAHAQTLLFSLDDALRYIPPAALMNPATNRYLVQDYRTALMTTVAGTSQQAINKPQEVLGVGVSDSENGLPALPGVERELDAIVRAPGDDSGILPGVRLLNAQFTPTALETDLDARRYTLVHVASHFLIGDTDTDSYLLLGKGSKLSVEDLRNDPNRFAGVELLTLSACDTAEEVKVGDGHEIDGFAALMQQLGARSVLASLWPVSDSVTPELMGSFYAYRTSHPRVPMAECLRQAQLALIDGAPAVTASKATRGFGPLKPVATSGLAYPNDPARPYAHPYYWAPFVLMGNGR